MAERVGGIFYDVSLDTSQLLRGSRVVDRETAKAARSFNAITAAVKLYAAALAVVKSAQLADDVRLLSGRVEVATRNLQEAGAAMQALQRISTTTGTSLEANAKVFTRLNQSVLEMGGNQNDTLRITELLGKAIRVSGASTVEATSTMTQFAQAMGSGKLAGDELRSMMENAPYLMRQLAAGLGVPIGALKQLGEEGKLTADAVANALQKAAVQIEADFKKLPQTLGTAFTVATDAAMRANEAFDTLTGSSAALTGATKGVGDVLDNLARQFALATSEGEKLGRNDTVKAWAEGTFTAISYVIDAGDLVVRVFRNIGIGIGGAAAAASAAARGGFTEARTILQEMDRDVSAINAKQLSGARMRQAAAALAVPDTYANRLDRAAAGGGPASNLTPKGGTTDTKPKKAKQTKVEFGDALQDMLDRVNAGDELKLAKLRDTLEEMKKFAAAGGVLPDSVWAGIAKDIAAIDPAAVDAKKALELLADTPAGKLEAMAAEIAEINRLYAAGALTADQWAAAVRKATGTADDGAERLKEMLTDTPTGKMDALLKTIEFINAQFAAGGITVEQWAELIRTATGTAENGVKEVADELDLFGKKLAENIQDTLGDGLYDAMTGNFKNIGNDFGKMLLRMLAQAQAADLARAMFGADPKGGLSGGWLGQLGSAATAFLGSAFRGGGGPAKVMDTSNYGGSLAIGGDAQAGKLHRINEKGRPEIFSGADGKQWMLPTTNGRVTPTSRGGAGSMDDGARGGSMPPVNVINNLGVKADARAERGPDGALNVVLNAVAQDTRSGGVTARAQSGRFGLNNGATLNRRRG